MIAEDTTLKLIKQLFLNAAYFKHVCLGTTLTILNNINPLKPAASSSKCYLRIQSVPQKEHHTSPLQKSIDKRCLRK
jgi:hypothetical protein